VAADDVGDLVGENDGKLIVSFKGGEESGGDVDRTAGQGKRVDYRIKNNLESPLDIGGKGGRKEGLSEVCEVKGEGGVTVDESTAVEFVLEGAHLFQSRVIGRCEDEFGAVLSEGAGGKEGNRRWKS